MCCRIRLANIAGILTGRRFGILGDSRRRRRLRSRGTIGSSRRTLGRSRGAVGVTVGMAGGGVGMRGLVGGTVGMAGNLITFPRVGCRSRGALAAVAGCFFLPKVRVELHKMTAQGASI